MILFETKSKSHSGPLAKLVVLVVLVSVLVVQVGCGGGNSSSGGNHPLNPSTAALQLNVGDDPSDRVAALLVNVNRSR